MSRLHGRQPHESRAIQISFEGLARVDGSARFRLGPIAALSTVSGPIEVRLASENASQATLEVFVRPLSNVPATEAKSIAATVRGLLTPSLILANNPRTLVQIVGQTLVSSASSSGSQNATSNAVTAALVNASSLALVNAASVPMRGVVCASTVGRRKDGGELVVDPDEGDGVLDADGCFAFLFSKDGENVQTQCVWTNWRQNSSDQSVLNAARELASGAATEVHSAFYMAIEASLNAEPRVMLPVLVKQEAGIVKDEGDDNKMEI